MVPHWPLGALQIQRRLGTLILGGQMNETSTEQPDTSPLQLALLRESMRQNLDKRQRLNPRWPNNHEQIQQAVNEELGMKIVQVVMNEKTLVALTDEGTLWQLEYGGRFWYQLPECREMTQEEKQAMIERVSKSFA